MECKASLGSYAVNSFGCKQIRMETIGHFSYLCFCVLIMVKAMSCDDGQRQRWRPQNHFMYEPSVRVLQLYWTSGKQKSVVTLAGTLTTVFYWGAISHMTHCHVMEQFFFIFVLPRILQKDNEAHQSTIEKWCKYIRKMHQINQRFPLNINSLFCGFFLLFFVFL